MAKAKKETVKPKKKKQATVTKMGRAYISATFNNTLVTITNDKGDVISWGSAGASGFRGTRKSTPFAATTAVENVVKKAKDLGMSSVDVFIKGPGPGRDGALRALRSVGISISQISDVTPIPHNGPRPGKKRRV